MLQSEIKWTNISVKNFSPEVDPINKIVQKVRKIILHTSVTGIEGPPFDPFEIAAYMGIKTIPRHDVPEARTVSLPGNKFLIEYNPDKPKSRVRFSIAHEITHTLFPDCADEIRNRDTVKVFKRDRWQLEMLCNIGASEILMPIGSFPDLSKEEISVGNFINLRKKFDVSTEALFLRAAKLTSVPCFIFSATRINPDEKDGKYKLDYIVCSKSWGEVPPKNIILSSNSVVSKCTAVGYKLISDEVWDKKFGKLHVECIGIPSYSNHRYPRVMGVVSKRNIKKRKFFRIAYKIGDATQPRVKGNYIIAHVVNDKALHWGGRGFAKFVKKKWPFVEKEFISWKTKNLKEFKLGSVHKLSLGENFQFISMVAQHGYGPSIKPRIRYDALKKCLNQVRHEALKNGSSVHMPRIGCGEAGGSWNIVGELIEEELCDKSVSVTIYDLPPKESLQLFDL